MSSQPRHTFPLPSLKFMVPQLGQNSLSRGRNIYMKRYTDNPLQVRLYESQEQSLNSMMQDHEYLKQRGIFNKSDAVRTALFSVIKDYEKYKFNRSITA